jgi:cbb3-type cytochrome oxidase maturation protein
MDIIYVLVPLSIALIAFAITVLFWAIKNGQFEDMDSPAHKILFDDDEHDPKPKSPEDDASQGSDHK